MSAAIQTPLQIDDSIIAFCDQSYFNVFESRLKAEKSFHEFVKQAWPHVEGGKEFVDGWHIQAICEHLEACFRGQIRNLLINIPPRCSKSTLVSVMFPAWVWIHEPYSQFLYASYAASLSIRDSVKCRRLITSPWYQSRWGELFRLSGDQNSKIRFENDKNGYRLSTSVGGTATGEGGDYLCSDDPNSADDAKSETKRQSTLDWFNQVWSTRLNDPKKGRKLVIQQRLHEKDVTGDILENDTDREYTRLILPMELELSRRAKTIVLPSTNGKKWIDPRTTEGELLWPERVGAKELKSLKINLRSPYAISGQLQQWPSPEGGGIIKASDFKIWKKAVPPKLLRKIGSLDTAFEIKDENAWSALTTWGYFIEEDGTACLILLNSWRGKVEYPDLRKICVNVYDDYRNDGSKVVTPDGNHTMDMLLVEAKANGISLVQDLRRAGMNAMQFNPTKEGDKMHRVHMASSFLRDGLVYVPAMPPEFNKLRPMSQELINQCKLFPAGESRDIVDTISQIILFLKNNGALTHRKDPNFLKSTQRTTTFYNDYYEGIVD